MNILCISGSASIDSSNAQFLKTLSSVYSDQYNFAIYAQLREWPLFRPEDLSKELPKEIQIFKEKINESNAVLICTPEYVHNIPAALKNMFEWLSASGEFNQKKVIAITLSPRPPRGKYAMHSLIQSLTALKATVVAQLDCYKSELFKGEQIVISTEQKILFDQLFELL
jgi:NAD(P)H-dependent FMN reductase